MARVLEQFWRLLPAVRSGERSRTLFFTGLFTLVTAAQTAGLAGSEALFLAKLSATRLPHVFIIASILTVLGSILYAARVGRSRNDDLFAQMLLGSGLTLIGVSVLSEDPPVWVLYGFVATFYLTQAVFTNHFWTFSGDYFDTITCKRLFPVFTVGASLGGLLGGAVGAVSASLAGPRSAIVAWGILLCAGSAMLWLARRPLRRWGPLELEEADETSVEGMRGAASYVRGSRLGRWLVLSAVGMVMAMFVAQYVYSDVFVHAYPDPTRLAIFISLYLAVTNLIEIGLELAVTPWLIRRFGVPTAHLAHPLLTIASFGAVAFEPGMGTAVAARMNRELVENAVAQPVRTLVFNALPPRFRGRIRALLEGIVVYAGMSIAGVFLLLIGAPRVETLAYAGIAAALLYLVANLGARSAYLRTLVDGIRAGRLDIQDLDSEIGEWEASRLAGIFEELLRAESERPSRSLLQTIPILAQRGVHGPLKGALAHPLPLVRQRCVEALADSDDALGWIIEALDDVDAEVRLAAVRALADRADEEEGSVRAPLSAMLDDPDPRVRSTAAAHQDGHGAATLHAMLNSQRSDEALAALSVATSIHADDLVLRANDPHPAVRAAALERLAEVAPDVAPRRIELGPALSAEDAAVRRAALRVLARGEAAEATSAAAAALADPSGDVRVAAVEILVERGEAGADAALPQLEVSGERTVEAALQVLASSESSRHRERLVAELRRRVTRAWAGILAFHCLPEEDDVATRFLHTALTDTLLRDRRLAFRALELLENRRIIYKVEQALRFGSTRARGDALEVLSCLGDRESARLLVLMHESGPLDDRVASGGGSISVPADAQSIIEDAYRSDSRWVRISAAALSSNVSDTAQSTTMERILALKRVPLFANLTLDQLEAVHQLASEATFLPGEVMMREGDAGGELFLLLEGSVDVVLDHGGAEERSLSVIEAVGYFGEMAILDDNPRSATVLARERSQLLVLDGDSLKSLILQMPEISFEIFRVLTARVRAAERRLRDH